MEKDDADLIREFAGGNTEAMETLFERYKKPVLNFALRILNNRADAEDVASEVFLVLVTRRYSPQPGAKFSTWLFAVARNACLTRVRKKRKVMPLWFTTDSGQEEQWDVPDAAALPREDLARQETVQHIRQAISTLPDEQKEALVLREYHNLSYDDISKVLGCSLEKVKILIYRARERLRADLPAMMREEHDERP